MDYIKYAILAGLAAVSYMLLLAWQEDYPQVAPAPAAQVASTSTTSDVPVTAAPAAADIPVVNNVASAVAEAARSNGDTFVTVKTDVLNVTIDRVGGDIVFVSLPEHATQLGADDAFVLLDNTAGRSYVAQSGLIGRNGIDGAQRAVYSASATEYQLANGQNQLQVDLTYTDAQGVQIVKRFSFQRGDYLINISYNVNNPTDTPWSANLFGQIKRGGFGDPTASGRVGMSSFLGFATTTPNDNYLKVKFDDIDDNIGGHDIQGGWVAMSQHYFISVFVPPAETVNSFSFCRNALTEYIGGFTTPEFTVAPNSNASREMG